MVQVSWRRWWRTAAVVSRGVWVTRTEDAHDVFTDPEVVWCTGVALVGVVGTRTKHAHDG